MKVTFTDDEGHEESLTSQATAEVAARANSPASGQPVITGTAAMGETLTATTSAIADTNGLQGASFSYQWLRIKDGSTTTLSGATYSTYTVADEDQGASLKVRVSFTDDDGHSESLTSLGVSVAEAENDQPTEPPLAPTDLTAILNSDGFITLSWTAPEDDSVTGYQILRRRPQQGESELQVYVDNTESEATSYTDTNTDLDTRYVYRVKAWNAAGVSPRSNYARVDKE